MTTNQSKNLDIAFVDFDDIQNPLLAGGQARATFEVSRRLVKAGHRATVICSKFPGSQDGFNEGIHYLHIGAGTKSIKFNNMVFFLALPFALRKLKADVIIEAFTAPISTCLSPLYTRIPVIGMPTMFEAREFARKYHIPFHWVEWLGAKFYKYFLAYSPLNKEKMHTLNPNIITRIIPNGVDEAMFDVKTSEGDYAAFIGRIDLQQKGLDLLLEACSLVKDKLKTKIIIAGNGPKSDEQKIVELINSYGLSELVSFIGRVDGEKKEKLLANAKFGIYPSRFEDFPLVPLEWTALGKPLICFDIPGMAWVDPSVALKAFPFSAQELSRNLIEMANNDETRNKMAQNSRTFAKKYGWNEIAAEYEEFCKEVIKLDQRMKSGKKGKKVLILGGAGFIGSMMSKYFYDMGDDVTVYDSLIYENSERNFFPAKIIKGDIRDKFSLSRAVRKSDVVINLAGLSNDPASDLDPSLTWEINYKANKIVADVCRKYNKRIIFASSCSVYGFTEDGIFNEESELNPVSLYAKTKALSEQVYLESGADVVLLRFATAYGYTEKPRFDLVVNTMSGTAYFDRKITVHGGNQWRPLVHIKDISRAVYKFAHTPEFPSRIYNIGSNDQNFIISDLAKRIAMHFPGVKVHEEKECIDGRSYRVDFSRVENEMNFKTKYTINDAVSDFRRAFRNNEITGLANDDYYRIRYLKKYFSTEALMATNLKKKLFNPLIWK